MANVKVGSYTSTGADYNVVLGFTPDYVMVLNEDAAEGEVYKLETWNDMTGEIQHKFIKGDSATSNGVASFEHKASGGYLSSYDSSTVVSGSNVYVSGGTGITVGSGFQDNGDSIYYMAVAK